MKHGIAISEICRQIKNNCTSIEALTMGIEAMESNGGSVALFAGQRVDLLEHLQSLVLEATKLIVDASNPSQDTSMNNDGSVFAAGELDHKKGDMTQEDEVVETPVDQEDGETEK